MDLEKLTQKTIITTRTEYQLRQFVVGQHDTLPMQWRQVVIEAQDLIYKIKSAEILIAKTKIEIDKLIESGDPVGVLDAEQKRLDIALTQLALDGANLELSWLKTLASEIGSFSIEDIENDQPNYWSKRLQRQADTDVLACKQGISVGNLESMLNAGLLQYGGGQCAISPGD